MLWSSSHRLRHVTTAAVQPGALPFVMTFLGLVFAAAAIQTTFASSSSPLPTAFCAFNSSVNLGTGCVPQDRWVEGHLVICMQQASSRHHAQTLLMQSCFIFSANATKTRHIAYCCYVCWFVLAVLRHLRRFYCRRTRGTLRLTAELQTAAASMHRWHLLLTVRPCC